MSLSNQFIRDNIPALPGGDIDTLPMPVATPRGIPSRAIDGVPRFEVVAKQKSDGSFFNVEYVSILTAGDAKATPRLKVTGAIREKYRPYYDLWRQGIETAPQGTPLEAWPEMTPALVMTFKVNNLFTVEQVRDCAEANDTRIPMFGTWKRKAREYLDARKGTAGLEAQARENTMLREGMKLLEQQMQEMGRRYDALLSSKDEPPALQSVSDGLRPSGSAPEAADAPRPKAQPRPKPPITQ